MRELRSCLLQEESQVTLNSVENVDKLVSDITQGSKWWCFVCVIVLSQLVYTFGCVLFILRICGGVLAWFGSAGLAVALRVGCRDGGHLNAATQNRRVV